MDEGAALIFFDLVYAGESCLYIVYQHNFGAIAPAAADAERVGGARHNDLCGRTEQMGGKGNCDGMVAGAYGGYAAGESSSIKVKHI